MKLKKSSILTVLTTFAFLGFALPASTFAAGPASVNLGTAGNFVILAKTGVSTTGTTAVIGDVGLSPAQATYITGFALTLPAASAYSTSALVAGKVYAPGYADPTPANISTAVSDMQAAYTDAAGRAPTVTDELGAGNIGGLALVPGVYKWGTNVTIPTNLTLSGGANDVWIFQIAGNLNISSATQVVLAGGAQAGNVFWQVAGQTTLGTAAVFNGNILDQTAIVLNTGATLNGRALAQSAVTLDSNTVTIPTGIIAVNIPPVYAAQNTVSNTNNSSGAVSTVQNNSSGISSTVDPRIALMSQLTALQAQLNTLKASQGGATSAKTITSNLTVGSKSSDVNTLQSFLISLNEGPAANALANVGATSYFGDLTRSALAEFQVKMGITPSLGYFGPVTRAYINSNY